MNWRGFARMLREAAAQDAVIDYGTSETPSFLPGLDDTRIMMGNGTVSWDLRWFGGSASNYVEIDASANLMQCVGASMAFNTPVGQFQLGGVAVTATAAELNAAADVSGRIVNVTDAATYAVLAADSGKPHIMPDFTASCTLTLPTAAAGLEYTFIGKGVAADGQNWIFSTGGANFWLGGLAFADTDDPADTILAVYPNGSSNDFMTIVTPGGGTRVHVVCDGTNWIANGRVFSATAPTFSDT